MLELARSFKAGACSNWGEDAIRRALRKIWDLRNTTTNTATAKKISEISNAVEAEYYGESIGTAVSNVVSARLQFLYDNQQPKWSQILSPSTIKKKMKEMREKKQEMREKKQEMIEKKQEMRQKKNVGR